ncbi:MAG: ROK family protein [Actinobacteria bacterium]|nr:ROK family protein [Actinomycetota bacterium]
MVSKPEKLVIGVDVGGTKTAAGIVNGRLEVIDGIENKTVTSSQNGLLDSIVNAVEELRRRSTGTVAAVGIGFPSMIDQTRGRAVMSVNIPLSDFDIVAYMRKKLGLPVLIDNDANLAALAELRAGSAREARDALMITVGTGIGGGVIIDGKIYRGAVGSGAELGHIVIDVNGPPCQGACPNNGCFETMASGTALIRYAREAAQAQPDSRLGQAVAAGSIPDGALVSKLAAAGDAAAAAVLEKIGFYIGVGITGLINVFNPEVFVLGGGVMQAGDAILKPALKYLHGRGLRPSRDVVKVVTARFGPEAGVLGAACLALDNI